MTSWTCPCPNCTDPLQLDETGLDITEGAVAYTAGWLVALCAVAAALAAVLLLRKVTRD